MSFDRTVSRRGIFAALGLIPAWRTLSGQQQQQEQATFSTGVKVVNLFANVRDKTGAIVKNLTKEDFLLSEDERSQVIRYFSQESDLPLTLGLMVDTSGSLRRLIEEERVASYRFFEQVLRPEKDVAFVIHFDFETELLQDITSSRKQLEKALDALESPDDRPRIRQRFAPDDPQFPFPIPGGGGRGGRGGRGGPAGGGRRGGGTVLYDAIMLASDELMRKQSGRKALILLSDGMDNGSKVSLSTAVEAAQRADTLVFSILFEDTEMYGGMMGRIGGEDGKKVLQRISRETGGRFFEVTRRMPLSRVFDEIDEDLRHQYSLGYSPDRAEPRETYHRIKLTTRQKGLIVQARDGYYGI
ncbi:MAG: VWA domain-containing protein [Candidatus Solibacter sp.]